MEFSLKLHEKIQKIYQETTYFKCNVFFISLGYIASIKETKDVKKYIHKKKYSQKKDFNALE